MHTLKESGAMPTFPHTYAQYTSNTMLVILGQYIISLLRMAPYIQSLTATVGSVGLYIHRYSGLQLDSPPWLKDKKHAYFLGSL